MDGYEEFYEKFDFPSVAYKMSIGEHPLPDPAQMELVPKIWFPPALLPIWFSTLHQGIIGFWIHWFSDRTPTIVLLIIDDSFFAMEIARNWGQLAIHLAQHDVTLEDRMKWVNRFSLSSGDTLLVLETFKSPFNKWEQTPLFHIDPPLSLFTNNPQLYPGDFPVLKNHMTFDYLRRSCSFEWDSHHLRRLNDESTDLPSWLRITSNQKMAFEKMIHEGDLSGAWLTLNSAGWNSSDELVLSANQLAQIANDPHFGRYIEAWKNSIPS